MENNNHTAAAGGNAKSGGLRLLTWLMIAVIGITAVINAFCVYNIFGKKPKDVLVSEVISSEQQKLVDEAAARTAKNVAANAKGTISYKVGGANGVSDIVINSRSDIFGALESIHNQLGIDIPKDEYKYSSVTENELYDVYTLKQVHDNLDVIGHDLKLKVDKDGNLLSVTGNHYTFPEDFEPDYYISDSEGKEAVSDHMQHDHGISEDDFRINSGGKAIFVEEEEPCVAYMYSVVDSASDTVLCNLFVDGTTADIIGENNEGANQRSDFSTRGFAKSSKDKTEYAYSKDLGLYIYDDFDEGLVPAKKDDAVTKAVLENITDAAEFYDAKFNRRLKGYYITMEDAAIHQQYFSAGHEVGDSSVTIRYEDKDGDGFADIASTALFEDCSEDTPVDHFGRELFLAIMPENIISGTELAEGLADVFGELCEDYCDGALNNSCDWECGDVNIADPAASGNAVTIDDLKNTKKYSSLSDVRHDSTIISHSAYLMANGGEPLTTEQLAYLYYNSLTGIPKNATYEQFRDAIIFTALEMTKAGSDSFTLLRSDLILTEAQLVTVIDAFDAVGIPRSGAQRLFAESYTGDAAFTVYGNDVKPYSSYHVTVVNAVTGSKAMDSDFSSNEFSLPSLEPGIYSMTVTDGKNSGITYEIPQFVVNKNLDTNKAGEYLTSDKLFTKFGAQERSVALVLDVSGSMGGTPITETKLAAEKFVDYVFSENPSVIISVIPYSSRADERVVSSNDKNEIISAIRGLSSGGGTNMHSGIDTAYNILKTSKSAKRLMIVMSDGYPESGPTGADGTYESAIIEKADEVKGNDIIIYSLGFFHNLSGSTLKKCQQLMTKIASAGCDYNVANSADMAYAFDDLADNVGGNYSVLVRIACPVDVTVKCGNEVLCSDKENLSTRASFGSLSFETVDRSEEKKKNSSNNFLGFDIDDDDEAEEDEVKVLRLNNDANYEICINGTGSGKMDYSISFANDDGEYKDVRTFKNIPISKNTVISTNTKLSAKTVLNVDSNGDGKFDKVYSAKKNSKGKEKGSTAKKIIFISLGVLLGAFVLFEGYTAVTRSKKNKFCKKCGGQIGKETKFCRVCGEEMVRQPLFILPKKTVREKESTVSVTAKLVVMGICMLITISVVAIYRSAATTIFKQLRDQELVSAQMLYDSSEIEDSGIQKKYLSMLTKRYLKQVDKKCDSGDFSESTANSIYSTVVDMDMGAASDLADEYLKDNGITYEKKEKKKKTELPTTTSKKTTSAEDYLNFLF